MAGTRSSSTPRRSSRKRTQPESVYVDAKREIDSSQIDDESRSKISQITEPSFTVSESRSRAEEGREEKEGEKM